MPTPDAMATEKERLYESSSLRDDLNDAEATVLLEWGESQLQRLANEFPDEFEAKARFLRQLLKNINRFVGQREFNEMEGQLKYMSKVSMYLEPLGWNNVSSNDIFAELPDDKANMTGNLLAIIRVLSPKQAAESQVVDTPPTIEAQSLAPNLDISEEIIDPIISSSQISDTVEDIKEAMQDNLSDFADGGTYNFSDKLKSEFIEAYTEYDEEDE